MNFKLGIYGFYQYLSKIIDIFNVSLKCYYLELTVNVLFETNLLYNVKISSNEVSKLDRYGIGWELWLSRDRGLRIMFINFGNEFLVSQRWPRWDAHCIQKLVYYSKHVNTHISLSKTSRPGHVLGMQLWGMRVQGKTPGWWWISILPVQHEILTSQGKSFKWGFTLLRPTTPSWNSNWMAAKPHFVLTALSCYTVRRVYASNWVTYKHSICNFQPKSRKDWPGPNPTKPKYNCSWQLFHSDQHLSLYLNFPLGNDYLSSAFALS